MKETDFRWLIRHDWWNISTLPVVVLCNWVYLFNEEQQWALSLQFWSFLVYIVCDTFWILLIPQCVGSSARLVILAHHAVCLVGWQLCFRDTNLRHFSALALLVEFNTLIKILKRYYRIVLLDWAFFASWFLLRTALYPYLLHETGSYCMELSRQRGPMNIGTLVFALCAVLTTLNFIWTWELMSKGGHLGLSVNSKLGGNIQAIDVEPPPALKSSAFADDEG